MIEAVIFDMDGVIVDSEGYHFRAFLDVLKNYNIVITKREYLDWVGITTEDIFRILKQKYSLPEDVGVLIDRKEKRVVELMRNIKLISGVKEFIGFLRDNGYRIALASGSDASVIEYIINKNNLRDRFEVITTLGDVKQPKPNPEMYLLTAHRLNVSPKNCLAIEDSEAGVNSAKNAGMYCIAVRNRWTVNHDVSRADCIVENLKDITQDLIRRYGG